MSGIAGYIINKAINDPNKWISSMLEPIRSRGLNDEGITLINLHHNDIKTFKTDRTVSTLAARMPHYKQNNLFLHDIAFLHTRYSIIDLSYHGHQPFMSSDGSIVAIYNGEIHNYIELRKKLKLHGTNFRTSCDTEVLVEGYKLWGDRLWEQLNGFWAVVIYDRNNKSLVFSRDRIGIAPLYYRNTDDGLFFSSCIQSLLEISLGKAKLNNAAFISFMQTGLKENNTTFLSSIHSFPSASYTSLAPDSCIFQEKNIQKFWNLPQKRLTENDVSFNDAVKTFREYFFQSVELSMNSDVKAAFELSGGIDSSSIVAAAATLRAGRISTYTAKMTETEDEKYASLMKQKFNIDYHVLDVTDIKNNFVYDIDSFHRLIEEPFDNLNIYIRHKMLSKIKKDGINVVITGIGGDYVFAGNESNLWPAAYIELKNKGWKYFYQANFYEFCRRTVFSEPLKFFSNSINRQFDSLKTCQNHISYQKLSFHERVLQKFHTDLPFLLSCNDHLTFGIPIENRSPLLDHNIIEIGLQLPIAYMYKNGYTKYLMRKAMEPYLPVEILWRKKNNGFIFPLQIYLRTYQNIFEPLLNEVKKADLTNDDFGTYTQLLNSTPQKLWRLLSVGIWLKNFFNKITLK